MSSIANESSVPSQRALARPKARKWTDGSELDFINSLLPYRRHDPFADDYEIVSADAHPFFAPFSQLGFDFDDIVRKSFLSLHDEIRNYHLFHAPKILTQSELLVWNTIYAKTILWNKFGAAIPRSQFTCGMTNDEGHLKKKASGVLYLPPCGVGESHLDRAFKGLEKKGWLQRLKPNANTRQAVRYLPFHFCFIHEKFRDHLIYVIRQQYRGTSSEKDRIAFAIDNYIAEVINDRLILLLDGEEGITKREPELL